MYIVIDSAAVVRQAHRARLPLDDLIERKCSACGEPVFLTRKQLDAYESDPAVELPLEIVCTRCEAAIRNARRRRGYE